MTEEERATWLQVRAAFLESKRNISGSQETYSHYSSVLLRFTSDFSKSPLDVSTQEVEQFIGQCSVGSQRPGQPVTASTRKGKLAILRSWYKYIQNYTVPGPDGRPRRLVPSDFMPPTAGVEYGKPARVYRQLSMAEVERIFSSLGDDPRSKRDRSWLSFMLLTGRRRSEVSRIRWKHLSRVTFEDGHQGFTYSYSFKGHSGSIRTREVPALAATLLMDALQCEGRLDTMQADSPLWKCYGPEQGGGFARDAIIPLSGRAMNRVLKARARACGIDPSRVSCHSLRHTIARERYKLNGRDVRDIASFLDHSSLATVAVYLDELVTQEDALAGKVEEHFAFLSGKGGADGR